MEKYRNRRELHRQGGKFAKAPTLAEQGYVINTQRRKCAHCGNEWTPIIATGKCPSCGTALAATE